MLDDNPVYVHQYSMMLDYLDGIFDIRLDVVQLKVYQHDRKLISIEKKRNRFRLLKRIRFFFTC